MLTKSSKCLQVIKLLKSKEASNVVDIKSWPPTLDTDELPKKKLPGVYRPPTAELVAYHDFSVSTTGMLVSRTPILRFKSNYGHFNFLKFIICFTS